MLGLTVHPILLLNPESGIAHIYPQHRCDLQFADVAHADNTTVCSGVDNYLCILVLCLFK
jgi:hypothetical protein